VFETWQYFTAENAKDAEKKPEDEKLGKCEAGKFNPTVF